jgi:hypothetical protein
MSGRFCPVVLVIWLAGCASTQLTFNTLDLASTSDGLITSQVLHNLSKFRSLPYAMPSQVSIPSGSATTTNSFTPTAGAPIAQTLTTTLANSASAPLFNATTRTHTTPNGSIGISATDQYSQNYTILPLEDPGQLSRLRALYRFGAGHGDKHRLLCEYPLVQKEQGAGGQAVNVYLGGLGSSGKPDGSKSAETTIIYKRPKDCSPFDAVGDLKTPDPAFLKPPSCVICDYDIDSNERKPVRITFKGNIVGSNNNVVDSIKDIKGPSKLEFKQLLGASIAGSCLTASTTIYSIDSDTQIHISPQSTCLRSDVTFEVSLPPKRAEHELQVNRLLSNRWVLFWNPTLELPPNDPSPQQGDSLLGHFGTYDVYLKESHEKEFSDFVLFALEATLQSAAGTGGKGTPQKGGTPSPVQLPAAATVLE